MTRDQLLAQLDGCLDEMRRLARYDQPTNRQYERFGELCRQFDAAEAQLAAVDAEAADQLARDKIAAVVSARIATRDGQPVHAGGQRYQIERGTPADDSTSRDRRLSLVPPHRTGDHMLDDARRAIDDAHTRNALPDHAAETATQLVRSGSPRSRTIAAQWATVTGDEAYEAAFLHLLADPTRGHLRWTEDERAAYQRVEEFRAASLTDAAGGFMVPLTLDPAIMLTSDGSTSALRQAARTVTTATDSWTGITSAGVDTHWRAEAAEVDDDAPDLDEARIPVHRADSFIPFSFEIGGDAPGFLSEMQRLLVDSAIHHETTAFTTGTGTGQPRGLVTALAGGSSAIAAAGEAIVAADVYGMQAALPARFSGNARWMSHIATMNSLAQIETTNGARQFPSIDTGSLLRKPYDELSTMDGSIDPDSAGTHHALVYGDFSTGMVIVDRIGTTIELVPHLMGANGRPTGQRGLLMWRRVGADVPVPESFRVLTVTTAV